jgi:regulator of sigma E protease
VSWLPLGGYVKMASQEEMASDALEGARPDVAVPVSATFEAQPIWKRMVVILAGVVFNVLFAWLAFSGMLFKNGRPVNPTTIIGRVVDSALPAAAAPLAAVQAGDRITAINGQSVSSWEEVTQALQQAVGDSLEIALAGRPPVILPIHHDALEERVRVSLALLPELPPVVGRVVSGGAASRAGLATGDTVLAFNGAPVSQWYDLVAGLEASAGVPLTLHLGRPGGRTDLVLTPDSAAVPAEGGGTRTIGRIGVYPKGIENRFVPLTLGQALSAGAALTASTSTFIVRSVRGMLTGRISAREVGGPIAIGQSAAVSARLGFDEFIMFMALISVNLAVVNLLPIPVLDGGQFLFLLGEAVIRRPLPARLRQQLTTLGLLLIGLLMVLAFSNDIRRLFGL